MTVRETSPILSASFERLCTRCEQSGLLRKPNGVLWCMSCGNEPNWEQVAEEKKRKRAVSRSIYQAPVETPSDRLSNRNFKEVSRDKLFRFPTTRKQINRQYIDTLQFPVTPIKEGNIPFAPVADVAALYLQDTALRRVTLTNELESNPNLTIYGIDENLRLCDPYQYFLDRISLSQSDLQIRIALLFLTFTKKRKCRNRNFCRGNLDETLSVMQCLFGRMVDPGVMVLAAKMCRVPMEDEGSFAKNPYFYIQLPEKCNSCLQVRFKAGYKASPRRKVCQDCMSIAS